MMQLVKLVVVVCVIDWFGVMGCIVFDVEGNLKDLVFMIYQVCGGKWVVVDVFGGLCIVVK